MRGKWIRAAGGSIAILLSACGGGGSNEGEGSPLDEFLGRPTEGLEAELDTELARQEEVATCMRERGFEYIPVDPSISLNVFLADEVDEEERIRAYGFGITTEQFAQSDLPPNVRGFADDDPRYSMPENPNEDIVDALSDIDQEAYFQALYGNLDLPLDPNACDLGPEQVPVDPELDNLYASIEDDLARIDEQIYADDRLIEYDQNVQECVAGKGFDYPGLDDVASLWRDELDTISEALSFPLDELSEAEVAALSGEELDRLLAQPGTFEPGALDRLAVLQAEELALAEAVLECGGLGEKRNGLIREIRNEYEARMVDANRDQLEEIKERLD